MGASEGAVRPEMHEAGVVTSEAVGKGDESPGGGCEGREDQGEGPSGLSAVDKGKGKGEEVVEETLKEE